VKMDGITLHFYTKLKGNYISLCAAKCKWGVFVKKVEKIL
jgi:hypothetical protein